jgi:hypothetical protein
VVFGAALQQGVQGGNIARLALLRAGIPTSVAGMSLDRQCASGLMAIATAAKEIVVDNMDVAIGGGVESISMVQTPQMRVGRDDELLAMHKDVYMPMLQTAEIVGKRYNIGREVCDEYALSRSSAPPPRSSRLFRRRDRAGRATMAIVQQGDQGGHPPRGHAGRRTRATVRRRRWRACRA